MVQKYVRALKGDDGQISPWVIALTVMLATFMEVLDTSVANVALPHIAGNLSATVDESTWVLTSYLVSNAIVLPLSGWFCTLFGRKRFFMICVGLFTVSSLLCGFAPNLGLLVFFRVLQGIGGGAMQPIAQAILVESFPPEKRGMAMAVYGMGVVFAPIIGPTLGGWITDNYSWRWIFFINLPVGAVALLLTLWLIFDPPYLVRKSLANIRIDYVGLGLLAVGLGFLQVVLDKGEREDWFNSNWIVWMSVIMAICLVAVVFWELRQREPVVDLRLLRNRNFALATLTMFALGIMLYGSTVLLPIYLQTLMGYDATTSGLVLSPGGFIVLAMLPLVGLLTSKYDTRWLITFGIAVSAVSLLYMARFNLEVDYRTAMLARCFQSLGMAFLFVPINTAAFAYMAKQDTNNATGIINLARNIGGSVGISGVATMLARRAQFHQSVLVGHLTPFDPNYRESLNAAAQALVAQGSDPALAQEQAHGVLYGLVQRHAAMLSFGDAFWLLAISFLAVLPIVFLMKRTATGKMAAMH